MNFKKLFRSALAVCALSVGFIGSASADYFSHVGDTTGKPEWSLYDDFGAPATHVPYDVFTFNVDQDGFHRFDF